MNTGEKKAQQRSAEWRITEQPSHFDHLEQMSVGELLQHINEEDMLVAEAVRRVLPANLHFFL